MYSRVRGIARGPGGVLGTALSLDTHRRHDSTCGGCTLRVDSPRPIAGKRGSGGGGAGRGSSEGGRGATKMKHIRE